MTARRSIVVKIGSSSVTTEKGDTNEALLRQVAAELAELRRAGHHVVVVTSGAIAAGWAALGQSGDRPSESAVLQALSAVGQHRLMRAWQDALSPHDLLAGQVLLAPLDFVHRQQYLHARGTLHHLLDLGVIPIVNENDATSDEEIRFGDNDRLAALVAHLVGADLLVLLTDTPGLLTADPRSGMAASLIEEVVEIDHELEALAGGSSSAVGSGGMASKLAAAKMATWSGVTTVIADARRIGVVAACVSGESKVGTVFTARDRRLSARKLWIAFALAPAGTVVIDDGARRALVEHQRSLLAAGVQSVTGRFEPDDAVEVLDSSGGVIAKGLVRYPALRQSAWLGRRSEELPDDLGPVFMHRDDLVVVVDR